MGQKTVMSKPTKKGNIVTPAKREPLEGQAPQDKDTPARRLQLLHIRHAQEGRRFLNLGVVKVYEHDGSTSSGGDGPNTSLARYLAQRFDSFNKCGCWHAHHSKCPGSSNAGRKEIRLLAGVTPCIHQARKQEDGSLCPHVPENPRSSACMSGRCIHWKRSVRAFASAEGRRAGTGTWAPGKPTQEGHSPACSLCPWLLCPYANTQT